MTDDEAQRIATQAIDTWPGGPKAYVWRNELRDLDAGLARSAMRQLRREHRHPRITTADLHAAYADQLRDAARNTTTDTCSRCQGTGWVDAPDRVWPDGRVTSQVQPCPCRIEETA